MIKRAIGFVIIAGAALSDADAASAQQYLIGTKSHFQSFQSQRDPNSGYCLDGTHVHNISLCGKAKGPAPSRSTGKTGKPQ